jgi:ribonucleoside-diphosphate reductase alpha chain
MNRDNPTPAVGSYESTNPCGEQPLLPYESCNLGSINVSKFVCAAPAALSSATSPFSNRSVDWERLGRCIRQAVRFLDNVITRNNYPLPQIRKITECNRKIGLGIMGFADYLILRGIPYDSNEALMEAETLMSFIQEESKQASTELAQERGAFPNFPESLWAQHGFPPLRNATTTTIAPTGTISILAGCSSGIEPLFGICYWRNVMENERLIEVHPIFKAWALEEGFYSEALLSRIASGTHSPPPAGGGQGGVLPPHIAQLFKTAHELTPEQHIRIQAAFQKYTDNAVSKTINFPQTATPAEVAEAFLLAYDLGCKGITVYRDGSRSGQVLNLGLEQQEELGAIQPIPVYGGCDLSRLWSDEEVDENLVPSN